MSQIQKEIKPETIQVVETAMLHSAIMIPGTGKTESTLSPVKVPGVKMEWIKGEGLLIECRGKFSLIPTANVKIVYFKK